MLKLKEEILAGTTSGSNSGSIASSPGTNTTTTTDTTPVTSTTATMAGTNAATTKSTGRTKTSDVAYGVCLVAILAIGLCIFYRKVQKPTQTVQQVEDKQQTKKKIRPTL